MLDFKTIPAKILKINKQISEFPPERRINICGTCREKNGDFKKYNPYLEDAGICNNCGGLADLINYSILELVENSGLTPEQFYHYYDKDKKEDVCGLRIIEKEMQLETRKEISKEEQLDFLERSIIYVDREESYDFEVHYWFDSQFRNYFPFDEKNGNYSELFRIFSRMYREKEKYLPQAKKHFELFKNHDYKRVIEILYPDAKKNWLDMEKKFPNFFKIKK